MDSHDRLIPVNSYMTKTNVQKDCDDTGIDNDEISRTRSIITKVGNEINS